MISLTFLLVMRLILAATLLGAGLTKLGRRREFLQTLDGYDLVPGRLAPALAWIIPRLEVLGGACLGVGVLTQPAAILSTALFAIFFAAVSINLKRGRRIECGCFGGSGRIGWRTAARSGLLAVAAGAMATWGGPSPGATNSIGPSFEDVAVSLMVICLILVFFSLFRELTRFRRLRLHLGPERIP